MLAAIVRGQLDPGWLADYARGNLRAKREELEQTLRGRIAEHHRFLFAELLEELAFIESRIARLETEIERRRSAHADVIGRLWTFWALIASRLAHSSPN